MPSLLGLNLIIPGMDLTRQISLKILMQRLGNHAVILDLEHFDVCGLTLRLICPFFVSRSSKFFVVYSRSL